MDRDSRFVTDISQYPRSAYRTYHWSDIDLITASPNEDIVPRNDRDRREWVHRASMEATIYGLPAVMQYLAMHQTLAGDPPQSMNTLIHDRRLADSTYAPFTTPNADTLYSQAWLDLRSGPLLLTIPPMADRYFTAHLLDAHSNAVNLSTRTIGGDGGAFILRTPEQHDFITEAKPVTVASPIMWLLGRIVVRGTSDLLNVHALQDRFNINALSIPESQPEQESLISVTVPASIDELEPEAFFTVLDHVLRINGFPATETAMVHRWRCLGLDQAAPLEDSRWDSPVREGIHSGYAAALAVVSSVRGLRGSTTSEGWQILDSGSYGFNYLHRAATNYMGLGATIRKENASFTTFLDGNGAPLDGGRSDYELILDPPEVEAFWSLSAYDVGTRRFIDNPVGVHSINDQITHLHPLADGRIHITLSQRPPTDPQTHWLPIHDGPLYLVLRAYLAAPEVVAGRWHPPAVRPTRRG